LSYCPFVTRNCIENEKFEERYRRLKGLKQVFERKAGRLRIKNFAQEVNR
jgi:hypothetical protein